MEVVCSYFVADLAEVQWEVVGYKKDPSFKRRLTSAC
jgi:hypothetical protein